MILNNPFCASFEDVRQLYIEHTKLHTWERFLHWTRIFSREQIKDQLDKQKGEIIDDIDKYVKTTMKKTEFVEFAAALQLADFYFPNEQKQICFDLKRNVDPKKIKFFEDLINSFEDNTHIDCLVQTSNQKLSFQIKRDYSDHTPEGFADWVNKKVFAKYGNMSGTSLVIFLRAPSDESPIDLNKLYTLFIDGCSRKNTFDKVSILYHDKAEGYFTLHELLPEHKRVQIPTKLALARLRGDA